MPLLSTFKRKTKLRPRRFGERGAVMVEATLTIPLYIILSLVLVDLCRLTFYKVTIQYVANQLIRDAVTVCDLDSSAASNTCTLNDPGSPLGPAGCRPRNSVPGGYLTTDDQTCYGVARAQQIRNNGISLLGVLAINLSPGEILICKEPDGCSNNAIFSGLPEDLISIKISKTLRPLSLFFLPIDIPVTLKVIGKNEAFYGV